MLRPMLISLSFAIGLATVPVLAQTAPGAPGTDQVIPEKDRTRPQDQPKTQGSESGENLSEKLNRTDGVLRPPGDVDPEIHRDAPATGTMPVIPPPGTPGSQRPNVDPK